MECAGPFLDLSYPRGAPTPRLGRRVCSVENEVPVTPSLSSGTKEVLSRYPSQVPYFLTIP